MTAARLNGLIPAPSRKQVIWVPGDPLPDPDVDPSAQPIDIGDARELQERAGSDAACFDRHGFALLDHRSDVTDWRMPYVIATTYRTEIDALIRNRLFSGRRIEIEQSLGMVYRGGGDDVIYADRVHQDFGLGAADFALNLATAADPATAEAWQSRYRQDDVVGCVAISFWRTIGLRQPLRHKPLALCDPASVAMTDVVPIAAAFGGSAYHIQLRFGAGQRWYYYPAMRTDEVLAFKLFECRKDDPGPARLRSVFHAAFDDPDMPPDAEPRRSCEHRVIVMLLAD